MSSKRIQTRRKQIADRAKELAKQAWDEYKKGPELKTPKQHLDDIEKATPGMGQPGIATSVRIARATAKAYKNKKDAEKAAKDAVRKRPPPHERRS